MTIDHLLATISAAPKPFTVVTAYECGKTRELACHSAGAAENHAFGERRKIGRNLIDRVTGKMVRVVSVTIVES